MGYQNKSETVHGADGSVAFILCVCFIYFQYLSILQKAT